MTDQQDPLATARAALEAGRPDDALRLAWQATMPFVLSQDDARLSSASQFAEEVAARSDGATRGKALQNAAYWAACIAEPRDRQGSVWSVKRWFSRTPGEHRVPCPDCAEMIMVNAKVCRFCSHRLA
jgi:hypothetical protein